ncbi:PREDICTED: insulin gene enhancer protein ISL-2 [Ficedula albicollis]|uniref:insulin gene enhancer protein ISL-2 n=1 Tax=Ficedula albicollis TaxID=59894 RepID=UPI0007AD8645|nr:PREDICTED: insulin gene enhancer protein ISL-2 [Ficedula albicollis]
MCLTKKKKGKVIVYGCGANSSVGEHGPRLRLARGCRSPRPRSPHHEEQRKHKGSVKKKKCISLIAGLRWGSVLALTVPRRLPAGRPGLALCAGCGGRIQDPFLLRVSPDLEWHVACLKCAECGQPLDETCTCFLRDGKAYCKRDYSRTTRVRTVLNEKQLHTLRTCYAANPRPDALMKEQLVEMTGLSPRVIRVWFQNKRCKDKKKSILMKQLQQQQHSDKTSLQGLTGTPLVAGSPIRHESAVQGSAVEVQTYQPPWKALSEFALQSDLEQPAAFQQLVSFSESGSLGTSSGSDVTSLSSQLPDTPNSMVPSPAET